MGIGYVEVRFVVCGLRPGRHSRIVVVQGGKEGPVEVLQAESGRGGKLGSSQHVYEAQVTGQFLSNHEAVRMTGERKVRDVSMKEVRIEDIAINIRTDRTVCCSSGRWIFARQSYQAELCWQRSCDLTSYSLTHSPGVPQR